MAVISFHVFIFAVACSTLEPTLQGAEIIPASANRTQKESFAAFPLTSHPEADLMPALSPDGKWLAYVSRQNKSYDVWVKPAAGGLATVLTTNTSDDYSPSWSPDGKALVFVSRRDDAEGDLFLLQLKPREDGFAPGKLRRLTANFLRETHPAFSPDGKKIAYSVGASGAEQIWLYEIKSKKSYPLTTRGGTQPAWSPDGKMLALSYPASAGEGHQVFVISSDTTQADYLRRQVTFEGDNFFPSFSTDGQKLLVQRFEARFNKSAVPDAGVRSAHLRVIALTHASPRLDQPSHELRLTPAGENALFPFWGSDGAIYYAAEHYGNFDLWRLPESGPMPRFLSPQETFNHAQKIADPEIALLAYSALHFYFPDSTVWLAAAGLATGRCHLALQDTAHARAAFEKVMAEYGDRFEAGLFAAYELARLAPALPHFEEISKRASAWPAVQAFCRLESARFLQRAGKLEAALRTFQSLPQQYANIHEACYEAWLGAAEILLVLGRPEEAEAIFVAIVQKYPGHSDWRAIAINHLLEAAPRSSLTADTLASYQRLVQRYAAIPAIAHAAQFRLASRLAREGENALADNEYRSLINSLQAQSDPYLQDLKAEAVLRLIRVQIANHELPAAAQLYANYLEQSSGTSESLAARAARTELTEALVRRGRVLVRAQDDELALSLFAQARQHDPRHVEAHRGYVEAMHTLGRIDEAVAEYHKLTARIPDNEILLYTLGLAYSYQGENDIGLLRRSSEIIERALALNYRLVPAYLTLSFNYEALEQLQQKERARKKGLFEKIALATPRLLDNVRRTVTFRPPKAQERWYERAVEALTTAIAMNDERADPQREAQLALNLANNYYNFGEFGLENAYRYYRLKLQYDSTFTSLKQKEVICERLGHSGWVAGEAQEAAPFLQQAVTLAQSLRDVDSELRNLLRLALLYQEAQDYESSITYYRQFINASRRENRTENIAVAWRNLAYNHQKLAETDEAVDNGERSLFLMAQAGAGAFPEPAKSKMRIKLFGLPVFWWTLEPAGEESSVEGLSYEQENELVFSIIEESWAARKEYHEAIATLEQKAESFQQRKYFTGEAVALNKLGILWYNLRDYQKSGDYFLQSFRLCDRQQLHAGKVINLINLGNLALLQQNWGREAVPFSLALDSLLQASQVSLAQVALQSPRQKLVVCNTLGNLYFYAAQQNWRHAAQSDEAGNRPRREDLQQNLQRTLLALQSLAKARAAYDTALVLAQAFRLPREEVMVRRNLASLLMLAGDYAPAWEHLTQALHQCLNDNYNDLSWRVAHALATLRHFYLPPAEAAFARASPWEWYDNAIAVLEALPGEPEGIEQRISEAQEQRELYEHAVLLLTQMHASNGTTDSLTRAALAMVERSHASRFVNLAATRYILPKKERHRLIWGGSGGLAAEQRRELSRLRGEWRKLEAEETPRPKELARVRAELAQAERDYQTIVQEALAEDPELASFFSVQPVDVRAVQNSLPGGTAVLQYFSTANELLIWFINNARVEQFRVPCAKENLRQLVASARAAWQTRSRDSQKTAGQLSALLLEPVKTLADYAQLIIIPDDGLHYLPFAALPYKNDVLAAQFLLTRAPSLQALQFAERHKNLNSEDLLLVEDAAGGSTETNDGSKPELAGANGFAATQKISGLAMRELRGADWRDPALPARQQIQTAGVLHLKHAFVALPDRPLDSGFVLRLAHSASRGGTAALLPLYRLFEFDLKSSLIVAENTSFPYDKNHMGEEMIALQRSLIYAGTPSLILNQWLPQPAVREAFYKTFYSCLDKFSLSDAFQAAQLAVRARFPEPADWAGFELAGFSGMSTEEKKEFADLYFRETVAQGNNYQELGAFGDAVKSYQTALTMARQLGQEDAVQRLYLLIKASAVAANDFATAADYEQKLLENARQAQDWRRETQSLRNLSVWRLRLQDYRGAIAAERQYLELAEAANNPLAAANSCVQLAQIHQAAAAYDSAISYAQAAADIFSAQNHALPRLQAETLLGKLALESDRNTAALSYFENALLSFQYMHPSDKPYLQSEHRAVATTTQLLGVVYGRLTAYRRALELHTRALQMFETLADTANIARAEQFVAETYWLNADYQNALSHQQRALKLAETLSDDIVSIRGQTALGLILLSLGDTERALDAQKQALQKALELEDQNANEARREQATIQKNLGLVYLQQRNFSQALASFRQAAGLDVRLNTQRGLLYDYLNLGQTFQALTQPDSALFYVAQAETLAVKLSDQRARAKALYTAGLAHAQKNNRDRARVAWHEALAQADTAQLEEVQWRSLWQLGVLARQENNVENALSFYQRAIGALERLSAKIRVEEYRSGFIDDKSEIYEEAVLLLLQMKREAEALLMAERAKSRSFADLLANGKIDWKAGADRALLERREQVLESVNFVQGQIATLQAQPPENTRGEIAALTDSLQALQRAYADLLIEMKTANPELADAVSVAPLPIAEVQAMLADSVALLEYFFAKDRLLCWVVDRAQVRAVATPFERNRLNENVVQFRKAIQKRASTESFARALYDLLIKPAEPFLQAAKQLVIVPHGALHYLPFPALQRADSTYLIDTHALALAPSATVLGFCYRKGTVLLSRAEKENRVLALGNPDLGNPRLDLPFAEKEIRSLEQTFGEITSYTRRQATPSALFASAGAAEVLHFSCHGVYDDLNPLFSALLLAPDSTHRTGRLEAHKIFGMQLQTSLVMLSACETGLVRVTGGDEVTGLARSFIFAGTPALIASLWTVDDLATAITVKRFYRFLKSGASKAQALREAQRFVRDHHNRHPAYWASFGLTGDWR